MSQQTLGEYLRDRFREAMAGAIKDSHDELDQIAKDGGAAAGGGIFAGVGGIGSLIGGFLGDIPLVGGLLSDLVDPLNTIEGEGGKLAQGLGIGWILGSLATEVLRPVILPLIHAAASAVTNEIFDPETAATLAAKGIITPDYGASEASGGGIDGAHFSQLLDGALTRPDVNLLLDLWLRGLIDETAVDKALARHGYDTFWLDPIKATKRSLLSVADLALAVLRGEVDQATAQAYATELGYDAADFTTLILNTGEPIGLESLLEAYRRGFIDDQTLTHGVRQSRVRDEWIPTILKLRYSPMSVADAIRARVENYIDDATAQQITEQNGLLPEHYSVMVESWGRPLSGLEMMSLYHRGEASLDQVRQALRESDVKDKYVEQAIELGRRLMPERQIVAALQHGVINHDRASQLLLELGYNTDDAETLIQLGVHEHTQAAKALSQTEVVAMYRDALMTREQAHEQLVDLGYTDQVATWLLQLSDAKAAAAVVRSNQAQIKASLRLRHITPDAAVAELVKLGVDHDQAEGLVDEWVAEGLVPTKTLSEAQIVKAAKVAVITGHDALQRLEGIGYAELDATILLESSSVDPTATSLPTPAGAPSGGPLPPVSGSDQGTGVG